MKLKVRGWSRNKRKPPQTLKEVSLSDDAQFGGSIDRSETRITAVPRYPKTSGIRMVEIDFAVNLSKFGGDYLASLHLTASDIKLLYELCFGNSATRRGVDDAAASPPA
jgi:hypothetical protein